MGSRQQVAELIGFGSGNVSEHARQQSIVEAVESYVDACRVYGLLHFSAFQGNNPYPANAAEKAKSTVFAMKRRQEVIRDVVSIVGGDIRAVSEAFRIELKRRLDEQAKESQ